MFRFVTTVLIMLTLFAAPRMVGQSSTADSDRAEAGRLLLEEGVEGLQQALAEASVPAMTFNQESQVRITYDDHRRALEALIASNGGSRDGIESEIGEIADQLLLAALKFLNPAQRTGLTGSLAAEEFADLNSDLPEEARFRVNEFTERRNPVTTGVHINVLDAFEAGGGTEKANFNRQQYEYGNLLMFTGGSLALRRL
jgi:hypothetical protein